MIFVSPHLDDAVLSCGELLSQRTNANRVITCLAGVPDRRPVTDYDVRSGFSSAQQAVTERRRENERAAAVLGFEAIYLDDFYDGQYGRVLDKGNLGSAMYNALRDGKRDLADSTVAIPLGLAHEDHIAVSDAVLDACRGLTVRVFLYEELPSRVLWPDEARVRLEQLRQLNWELYPRGDLGRGDIEIKELAVRAYRSQLWALDWRSCLVPERYWEAQWKA